MIPRAEREKHLTDFARATTTEQVTHLQHDHDQPFADVFAGERRVAHRQLHRDPFNPEVAHRH